MQVKTPEGAEIEIDLDQYADQVKDHFEKKGSFIRTKEELDASVKAAEAAKEKETADAITKKLHTEWEETIGTALGTKRPDGAKGFEWAKTEIAGLKEKASKADIPPPAGSAADDVLKAQLKKTQEDLEALKSTMSQKEKDSLAAALKTARQSSVKALNLDGDSPEEKRATASELDTILEARYKFQFDKEDNLIIYDGDSPVLDPETANSPMTIDKLVATKYKRFLAAKKEDSPPPIGGTGTKPGDVIKDKDGKEGIVAKTVDEIRAKAARLGHPIGSPEYKDFMDASLKLSKLSAE